MKLLFGAKNIIRSSYIWNTTAGILNASQSVILLVVITRTNGIYDAGVFSIAYAIANLTLTVGKYGMRSFQVSDINEEYKFDSYLGSRVVTSAAMILTSFVYALYGLMILNYTFDKFIIVLLICFLKLVDVVEDVFHGNFQQKGRLDVASKAISIRFVVCILGYVIALFITNNLIISTIICIVLAIIAFCIFTLSAAPNFNKIKCSFKKQQIKGLLSACFALCAGGFLSMYIGNAPKYAIDANLSQTIQAYYNFIFMPVFVISLLANFVFNPILARLAEIWDKKIIPVLKKMIIRQIVVIIGITIIVVIGAYIIGIPILSWLYDVDLSAYRLELCILLLGGGMLGLVSFFTVVITVARHQKQLLFGYLGTAILAKLLSTFFVTKYGIMGAALLYSSLIAILACVFFIMVFVIIKKIKE